MKELMWFVRECVVGAAWFALIVTIVFVVFAAMGVEFL